MTQTSTTYRAAVTLEQLNGTDYLTLIGYAKTELEALAAGMHGQEPGARLVQNEMWSEQSRAMQEIVQAALAAGVEESEIKAITWRETY